MSEATWHKLMAYVIAVGPLEINGFGYVRLTPEDTVWLDRDGAIWIDDVFIIGQLVTAASANTDKAALDAHIASMVQGGTPMEALRFQWHSHVDADAYCSGTDTDSIDQWPGHWLISLVTNKRGERYVRFDTFTGGVRVGVEIELEIVAVTAIPSYVMDGAREEIAALVRQPQRRRPLRRRASEIPVVPTDASGILVTDVSSRPILATDPRPAEVPYEE